MGDPAQAAELLLSGLVAPAIAPLVHSDLTLGGSGPLEELGAQFSVGGWL